MKKSCKLLFVAALCLYVLPGCSGLRGSAYTLTLAHVNDTHGHLDPVPLTFALDNTTIRTDAGGFPRLAACVRRLRSESGNLLFTHSGDVFQGTLYFNRFGGRADCNLLNLMGLDAMAPGNHEFDRGPQSLAAFADLADFSIVSANIDVSKDSSLRGVIRPYCIKTVGGRDVGIIGLTTPDTLPLSYPGQNIAFLDPEQAARSAVAALAGRGVHIIVVLSHLGYEKDVALAARLPEVDIIAGGHTHTLLGDFRSLGLAGLGPYPTVCKNADNATLLVVQAWEWARVVGALTVSFDSQGRIARWSGMPLMPVGTAFFRGARDGGTPVDEALLKKIRKRFAGSPGIISIDEDARARSMLEPYAQLIAAAYRRTVARAADNLEHVRLPVATKSSVAMARRGSQVAPLVADAILWKVRSAGPGADAALVNAGAVRGSIRRGRVSAGQLADLLPFGNRLLVCTLSGKSLKEVLAAGIDRACSSAENDGAFPYVAGIRYRADLSRRPGRRLVRVEILGDTGAWEPLADGDSVRVVTSNYLLDGRDGYDLLPGLARQVRDTGYGDAEAFIEYAALQGVLRPPVQKRVTVTGF